MIGAMPLRRPARLALASFTVFLLAAIASELVARQAVGTTVLWPSNAILLGLLLTHGRTRGDVVALMAGGALASLLFTAAHGQPLVLWLFFPLANLVEAGLALLALRAFAAADGAFERLRDVAALLVTCSTVPIVSAGVGALGITLATGTPLLRGWLVWYGAAALSLALITPAAVVTIRLIGAPRRTFDMLRVSEVVLILGLVAAVSMVVFAVSGRPYLFTILPFVLIATFRLRQFGSVVSVAIVAAIALYSTAQGWGPIARSATELSDQFLLLQFFLAVTFLSSLPVAALLAERDASEERARLLAEHFKAVVENASEVIFRCDSEGRWTYLNPAWRQLSGYPVETSLGQPLFACVDPAEQSELADWASPVFQGEVKATRRMLRFLTGSGNLRWMELSIQSLCDPEGAVIGATGTLRDIDDRKRLEEHVLTAKRRAEERARAATVLASTDELTGLANRRAFLRHLDRQSEASQEFGWRLTVAMFDVDHFKAVNDAYGHEVGDRVLQLVAARSMAVVRSGDLVGRLGGEEFGILMPGASAEDAAIVAERLRQAIEAPGEDGDGQNLPRVTVSIGIASQDHEAPRGSLLSAADAALYAAKGAGRNRVKIAA